MIPLLIYLWDGKILIRAKYGNGIAIAEECCCEQCNCDQLPDTLYAKIKHTVNVEGGGVTTATTYFELTSPAADDGCACVPLVDTGKDIKSWHGIFARDIWTFIVDHYELVSCNVHMVLNCTSTGISETLELVVGIDYYDCITDTSSGVCNDSGAMTVPCPITYPINLDPTVGDITDMWLSDGAWS